jgi:ribosomal-protein-alanine N-acetyltransferase
MSGGVTIRGMREDDLEQVQGIDRLSFSMPWPAKAYRYELRENPHSLLWVAEIAQTPAESAPPGLHIAGMIVVWLILEEAHIATIAVHPEVRGRGIAKELLATGLAGAIEHRAELATLEVRAGNIPAQKLYDRFKFEIVGRRPRYYKDNQEDALIMTVKGLGANYLAWLIQGDWQHGVSG